MGLKLMTQRSKELPALLTEPVRRPYLDVFLFAVFFLPSWHSRFLLSFTFFSENFFTSFKHAFRIGLLWTNSVRVPPPHPAPKNVLILPPFQTVIFTRYKILDREFSVSPWKMCRFLLASGFLMKNLLSLELFFFFSVGKPSFSLACHFLCLFSRTFLCL